MECVRFERFADVLLCHFVESAGTGQVNGQSDAEDQNGGETGLNVDRMEEQAVKGLIDDVEGGDDEKSGFKEGGEIFEFAVAVGVARIRGLIGDADRKEGDDRGNEIQAGMEGFGEDTEAARSPNQEGLQAKEEHRGTHAEQRGAFLFLDSRAEPVSENHEV